MLINAVASQVRDAVANGAGRGDAVAGLPVARHREGPAHLRLLAGPEGEQRVRVYIVHEVRLRQPLIPGSWQRTALCGCQRHRAVQLVRLVVAIRPLAVLQGAMICTRSPCAVCAAMCESTARRVQCHGGRLPQDHFRKSRKPSYTNVFHDRGGIVGVVEFETKEDLKAAIHDLDGEPSGGCC
jgi:hypothetical protein